MSGSPNAVDWFAPPERSSQLTLAPLQREGHLSKEGFGWSPFGKFQRRYVLLAEGRFCWSKGDGPSEAGDLPDKKGFIDFAGTPCIISEVADNDSQFTVQPDEGNLWSTDDMHTGVGSQRVFLFDTKDSEFSRGEWISWFREHVQYGSLQKDKTTSRGPAQGAVTSVAGNGALAMPSHMMLGPQFHGMNLRSNFGAIAVKPSVAGWLMPVGVKPSCLQ